MQQVSHNTNSNSNNGNNNSSNEETSVPGRNGVYLNGHSADPSQLEDDELGSDEVISFKRLGLTSTNTTTSATTNNNNNNGNSNSASPLNLSVDADDSQPDSSIATFDSKVIYSRIITSYFQASL